MIVWALTPLSITFKTCMVVLPTKDSARYTAPTRVTEQIIQILTASYLPEEFLQTEDEASEALAASP